MYNRVILMGRLTADPELRTTQGGISMCRISVAVQRSFARQGEERQTDFFDVTCWRQTAEFVCKYFSKGSMIHVEGKLQNNNYTDQNGVKHYSTAIIADQIDFCGDKRSDGGGNQYGGGQYGGNQSYGNSYGGNPQYGNQQYNNQPYNGGGNQYQQSGAPAPAPPQQSAPPPPPQGNVNRSPQPIELGDLGDFEEILSDGEVPF